MVLPIGTDDFGEIIERNLDYVDKSLFIKAILDDIGTKVVVILRPRRFGKTLNQSMLHYFLATHIIGRPTKGKFDKLKIAQYPEYMQHQGKYPVIFISLKNIKDHSFEECYATLSKLMSDVYSEHTILLSSTKLSDEDKNTFNSILRRTADKAIVTSSLKDLTKYLYQHFDVKPYLLIDEYDTPIQESYIHGYYEQIIYLMRGLLGQALKTNPYLEKGIITGILRISKESLFSDINNLKIYSMLNSKYGDFFGFTEQEVTDLITRYKLNITSEEIKHWYNGYLAGDTVLYNPWSIVNCISENGLLQPYWINTSQNKLIRELLIQSHAEFKAKFEQLLRGETIQTIIDEHVVFADLKISESATWSLFFMSGYLKVISSSITDDGNKLCEVRIPNHEIEGLYKTIIRQWLANGNGLGWYDRFLESLLLGQVKKFEQHLIEMMRHTVSFHDTAKYPEAFYHGLMLGLIASLDKRQYEIKSNRESGDGRYDIVIIPTDPAKLAIILEFKSVKAPKECDEEQLDNLLLYAAQQALQQIHLLHYETELKQRGLKEIIKIGLAFSGKHLRVV